MNKIKISKDLLIPDLIKRYPASRAVLDRYGLKGCGGPHGPRESLAWFAGLHGVDLSPLLQELNEAAQKPDSQPPTFNPSLADTIYRPFFLAGLVVVLSLGCVWGAINLLLIGLRQDFGGVSYSWILAHGDAMIFGFVGLFIMGFAYQAFPRFKHTSLWRPRLAFAALPLMAAGILVQTLAHLLAPHGWFLLLGIAGGLLEVAAVTIFAVVIRRTNMAAQKPEAHDRFIYAALSWFLLAALANPVIFYLFEAAATPQQFLFRVATFNIPYRDVQILGIAVVMILGVSLRFLPHAYGLRPPSAGWRGFIFWGVNGAIAVGTIGFLLSRFTGVNAFRALQSLAALVLLAVAVGTPGQFRLFGAVPESERDRGLKFIQAAYIWFILAMTLLALVPVYNLGIYQPLTGAIVPFSHAFFGAYRHALTVGFIMMMIVGVSSKVAPTLSGVDPRQAASLWPTFLLLNVGNALRISTEIATDFVPSVYLLMGVSGFFEVVGLGLWGYELYKNIRTGRQQERMAAHEASVDNMPLEITPQTKVGDILERHPETLDIFLAHGFTPLRNPVLRRTMARVVTLEQACRREEVDLEALMNALCEAVSASQTAKSSQKEFA